MTDEAITAESMPAVRKGFKVLAMVAFAFVWISAMFITISVMLDRGKDQPWFIVFSLLVFGVGADFWVGAGPVILRATKKWGVVGWERIGVFTLVLALMFSYSNKVAFWVAESNKRAAAHDAMLVDHLVAERQLVTANPDARLPVAVKAELDAKRMEIAAKVDEIAVKRQEIASIPPEWPVRHLRGMRELSALSVGKGKMDIEAGALASEYATDVAVAQAKQKLADAAVEDAARRSHQNEKVDPVIQWVIDMAAMFNVTISDRNALVVLHMSYAFFHEMAQFSLLGLATLRIPISQHEDEINYLIRQRKLKGQRRAQIIMAKLEEARDVLHAQHHFKVMAAGIPKLATDKAEMELASANRDVLKDRRWKERQWQIEDAELDPVPDDHRIENKAGEHPGSIDPAAIQEEFRDAVVARAKEQGGMRRKIVTEDGTFETYGIRAETNAFDARTAAMHLGELTPQSWLARLARKAKDVRHRSSLFRLAESASKEPIQRGIVIDDTNAQGGADPAGDAGAGDSVGADEPVTVQRLSAEEFDRKVRDGEIDAEGNKIRQQELEPAK